MYRYTVTLYTTCTDEQYFCLQNCTMLYNLTLPTHTCVAHTILGSVVRVYCSPVSVHLYCKLVLTNESPSKITFMNRVIAKIFRHRHPHHHLNCSKLTMSFAMARDVVKRHQSIPYVEYLTLLFQYLSLLY